MRRLSNSHAKPLQVNLIVTLCSILAVLIAAEACARLVGRQRGIDFTLYLSELKNSERLPRELFVHDELLGTKLRPSTSVLATTSDFSVIYKINSKGLRDKEYDYMRTPGKSRILTFGDSSLFGEGVPYGKRFADIPENALENVELINLGVPGYGLDQELVTFATEGVNYSADVVLLFTTEGQLHRQRRSIFANGTIDSSRIQDLQTTNPTTAYLSSDDKFYEEENALLRHSAFLSYMKYTMERFLLIRSLEKRDKEIWAQIIQESESEVKQSNLTSLKVRTHAIMEEFYAIAEVHGMILVVINIGLQPLDSSLIVPGVHYFDFSGELMQLGEKQDLSFTYDRHYNPKTHEYLGNRLTQILNNLTLPSPPLKQTEKP